MASGPLPVVIAAITVWLKPAEQHAVNNRIDATNCKERGMALMF